MVKDRRVASVSLAVSLCAFAGLLAAPALASPPVILAQGYFDTFEGDPEEGDEPALDEPNLDLPELEGEIPGGEPLLKPDVKGDSAGVAPPQSTEESKDNKLGADALPLVTPLDRPKMLAQLYEELSGAKSASRAEPIMKAIEELWTVSGSDTVNLLMNRAAQFANAAELELSLSILDAVVDIAPQQAEAWYLRAKVHLLEGKPERALADLRRALNLDPNHYRAINDLGLVLEQIGAKKEALEAYRRALKVNPFLDDAQAGVDALAREVEGQDI